MKFLKDESGQGAAEYILLFGGVIVIAIAALLIYQSYFTGQNLDVNEDITEVRTCLRSNGA
jgi:Flp pilus assembly pilin Flp